MPKSDAPEPLSSTPKPSTTNDPSGIAADDAGATSMAERMARQTQKIAPADKARLGAEASRDEDA